MTGRPIKPDGWRTVCVDEPDGVIVARNSVPPGFFLMQSFLPNAVCDEIVRDCETREGVRHTVGAGGDGSALSSQHKAARTSEMIDVRTLGTDIMNIVRGAFVDVVAPHFQKQIDWFELPEILRYKRGGEYKPHTDAENWITEKQKWERVIDRDLSILIYLNEGFTGGEIVFPNFGLSLPPKRGLLIAFPSDRRYLHAARPVTSGVRYSLVSWAAVKGGARVNAEPRPHATRI